jgi:hypothetical protein
MSVAVLRNQLPREKWAKRIAVAWQKQVPSIFEVGALLEAAKAELKHGEWMALVKEELPFGQSTANKLMKIFGCEHMNSDHAPNLPVHWMTLHDLALLTPAQFEAGIASGAINPKMQRKDVKALRGDEQVTKIKKEKVPSAIGPLDRCPMTVRRIVLDTINDMDPAQWDELLAELRGELDDIEKIISERKQSDGHHAARQSA